MSKNTVSFVCQECGYESPQWLGKCPECNAWNSLKEFHATKNRELRTKNTITGSIQNAKPRMLSEINLLEVQRIPTGFGEMDAVLGGGIVPGSVMLVAGDPGIGKSTLLLQLALNVSSLVIPSDQRESRNLTRDPSTRSSSVGMTSNKVLYISGEESVEQIKLRASRIQNTKENKNFLLTSLSNTDWAVDLIEQEKPTLVIIDSIQTMESEALEGMSGSVGQVRYSANAFIRCAKQNNIPIIIVGHVTKEGMVAGPMVLSHMVDTVLFLEGEKFTRTRILRSLKNRFGPVDEVGVFLMEGEGMQEVKNPEQLFLTKREESVPGSVLVVIMEGTRPFLLEIQALAVYSKLPMPRRVASGVDYKRVELLLAVLQKQCHLNLDSMDVFVNVAGGMKVTDRALDLGICLAIFSSLKNKPLANTVGIAEVGLLGELRGVGGLEKRVKEAEKLGFKHIISSKTHKTLKDVLGDFGLGQAQEHAWQQEDERHWKKQ